MEFTCCRTAALTEASVRQDSSCGGEQNTPSQQAGLSCLSQPRFAGSSVRKELPETPRAGSGQVKELKMGAEAAAPAWLRVPEPITRHNLSLSAVQDIQMSPECKLTLGLHEETSPELADSTLAF